MKITAKVIEVLPEQGGVSQAGNVWRKAQYIVEERNGIRANQMIIPVWDGTDHRIDRLNLTVGNTYELFIDCDIKEYNGNRRNDFRCWGANIVPDPKSSIAPAAEPTE